MNKKLRRIVAIIALVFVGICTVSIVLTMANSNLLNGQIGFLTLYTGGIGLALFAVIKITDYRVRRNEQLDESVNDSTKDDSQAVNKPIKDKPTTDTPIEDKSTEGTVAKDNSLNENGGDNPTQDKPASSKVKDSKPPQDKPTPPK